MFLCILAIHVCSKLWVTVHGAMELMNASDFLPGVQWQETKLNTNFYLMMKPKACTSRNGARQKDFAFYFFLLFLPPPYKNVKACFIYTFVYTTLNNISIASDVLVFSTNELYFKTNSSLI